MNSSPTSYNQVTPPECEIYTMLGGRLDHTSTQAYAVLVFLIVVNIIACPLTTVFNVLVVVAVKTKLRLKIMSNVALGCLATTDGLVGVIAQPLFVAWLISVIRGGDSSASCTLHQLSVNSIRVLCAISLFHLVVMNVERYIAIKHSFEHITLVTVPRILYSSALAWIAGLVLTIPVVIVDTKLYLTVNNINVILSLAITAFCQIVLYNETRRHEKQIATQQVSMEARQKFLKEKKALKLTTTILFVLLLTYSPIIVVRILLTNSVIQSINAAYSAFFTAVFVVILNSVINPIIYCIRIRQFRVAFIEIVLRKSNTQAEDFEKRFFGTLKAVGPHEEENNSEGHNNDEQENSINSDNNGNNNINDGDNNDDNTVDNDNINNATTSTTTVTMTKTYDKNNNNNNSNSNGNNISINDKGEKSNDHDNTNNDYDDSNDNKDISGGSNNDDNNNNATTTTTATRTMKMTKTTAHGNDNSIANNDNDDNSNDHDNINKDDDDTNDNGDNHSDNNNNKKNNDNNNNNNTDNNNE